MWCTSGHNTDGARTLKWKAACVPMRPTVGKPTQEYGNCTHLQILITSFFYCLSYRRSLPFGINFRIFIIKKMVKIKSLNNVNKIVHSP